MTRPNVKGRSTTAPFVKLDWFMLDSAAWLSLSTAERTIYIELARRYNGRNNGWLALSVRDAAARSRVNKDTARRCLITLQERGFTVCVTPGGFSRKVRHATEWRLTAYACDKSREAASKAFVRWRPEEPSQKEKHGPKIGPKRSPAFGQSTSVQEGKSC